MTISNRVFGWIFVPLVLTVGFAVGYQLSGLAKLEADKLLNVAGLSYTLLGVLVLSEVLATEKWKKFCVNFLAPAILWFHSLIPMGAFLACESLGRFTHRPSWSGAAGLSFGFFVYSTIPLGIFDEIVVSPRWRFVKRDIEARWRWLGFFLILTGVTLQLVSALLVLE